MTILNLLGEPIENEPQKSNKPDKAKRNWENRFQRWCNKMFESEETSIGKCGNGEMCDYCADNSYGRPCVRALNLMLREKQLPIDYSKPFAEVMRIWREHND